MTDGRVERINAALAQTTLDAEGLRGLLAGILREFDCVLGTLHDYDPTADRLDLRVQIGVPPVLLDKVTRIPVGKGMAGLAAQRREAVQVCNLQSDASGVAKPAARETRMEGALTAPMLGAGGDLLGTLGIAKPVPHEFTPDEIADLMRIGRALGEALRDA